MTIRLVSRISSLQETRETFLADKPVINVDSKAITRKSLIPSSESIWIRHTKGLTKL